GGPDRASWLSKRTLRQLAHVLGLQALRTLHHLELHLLAFGQRAESLRFDGGVMAEDVFPSAVLGDEAIALRVVEPLHGTSRHSKQSFLFGCGLQAGPELSCYGARVRLPGRETQVKGTSGQPHVRRSAASDQDLTGPRRASRRPGV